MGEMYGLGEAVEDSDERYLWGHCVRKMGEEKNDRCQEKNSLKSTG
jgi:hypothetical protein